MVTEINDLTQDTFWTAGAFLSFVSKNYHRIIKEKKDDLQV